MKDGESMEAKLKLQWFEISIVNDNVRKQRMKLDLKPSVQNVKAASLSFLQSVHH